jgi:molybdopterin molybdotransferase
MPEFLTLLPPSEARALLFSHVSAPLTESERIDAVSALGRVVAEDILAPHPLPEFPRSSMDGYAVRASDTFGASDSLPAYLSLTGEVPMGAAPAFALERGQCALVHTGGMLPDGCNAVVMLEYTQTTGKGGDAAEPGRSATEVEILRAVAEGENIIRLGEDVGSGSVVLERGRLIRPAEIGGLMALGILSLRVVKKPRIGLISSGDEVVDPSSRPLPGQVRDVNAYTLGALVAKAGGQAVKYGIMPDQIEALQSLAKRALGECAMVIITAGSSASTRDMTAQAIGSLGAPGVLVHGVNSKPGKPTILGACDGKAVIGLPGNPVSALVNGYLFVIPVIERLLGAIPRPHATVTARLTINLASQAGREDWWPVLLIREALEKAKQGEGGEKGGIAYRAEPIFGKSNLIFTLAAADGLLRIPPDATGLSAGELVEVDLLD